MLFKINIFTADLQRKTFCKCKTIIEGEFTDVW